MSVDLSTVQVPFTAELRSGKRWYVWMWEYNESDDCWDIRVEDGWWIAYSREGQRLVRADRMAQAAWSDIVAVHPPDETAVKNPLVGQ